jgi:putative PIN family toxin of toxin-antitoxin system
MQRIVLDTNVIVAGLQSRNGASNRLLRMVPERSFALLLSVPLFLEYESVLKRPERQAAHGLSSDQIDTLLAVWARFGVPVNLHYLWRPQLRDAADEMVLETAVNGRADGLVTFNVQDFKPAARRFGIELLTPAQWLAAWRAS